MYQRPDYFICDRVFYEEFLRALSETIWTLELERAKKKLGAFSSQHKGR